MTIQCASQVKWMSLRTSDCGHYLSRTHNLVAAMGNDYLVRSRKLFNTCDHLSRLCHEQYRKCAGGRASLQSRRGRPNIPARGLREVYFEYDGLTSLYKEYLHAFDWELVRVTVSKHSMF